MRILVCSIISLSVYFLNMHEVIGFEGDVVCCGPDSKKCCCETPTGQQEDIFLNLYPDRTWKSKEDFISRGNRNYGNKLKN